MAESKAASKHDETPCPHATLQTVTTSRYVAPPGQTPWWVVALQARCEACEVEFVFPDLTPAREGFFHQVATAAGGREVRLACFPGLPTLGAAPRWTRAAKVPEPGE